MGVHDELFSALREAMKSGDKAKVNAIRQVESEVSVVRAAPGFDPATDDDDLYVTVIAAYVKKMEKARRDYEDLGEAGKDQAAKLAFEVEYLSQWVPADESNEEEARAAVRAAIAELRADDVKMAGQVTGLVMRSKPGLDGAMVNRLAREELAS